ncbi:MAG TPA: trypsin-like peptidase domain-containing protein, partial [Candidatus Obscuribacterales bacterium]
QTLVPAANAMADSSPRLIRGELVAASGADILTKGPGIPITSTTIADIATKVAPAVVNIVVDKPVPAMGHMKTPFGGFPFEQFEFYFNDQRMSPRGAPPRFKHNTGSGFIIKPDGYILTNYHVVRDAPKITVTLSDKRTFSGKVVGSDEYSDLAVLKIEANDLPFAAMGTSHDLRPGEFVIAVGSPMGYDHSVTLGIVSAVGRVVSDVNKQVRFIQTDAAINPGNSGGPLLNLKGEVIGVNTAIHATAQNIGFSIPVDIAKPILSDLIAGKSVERPWVGIEMSELTSNWINSLGLPPTTKGVLVSRVVDGSPAQLSGLEGGDVILKIDGKDITEMTQVQDIVREHKIKDTLNFMILRNKAAKALAVTIGNYPSETKVRKATDEDHEE